MKTYKNKRFDCVKMMRDIRNRIDSDISNMSADDILKYISSTNDLKVNLTK
jgi:hypothetical protein